MRRVTLPAFAGSGAGADAYADRLFGQVAAGAGYACGYVVDLRGNTGGNNWPMLIGLSGLLGDGRPRACSAPRTDRTSATP